MQGIVQPHGGSVNAETAVGQGTTVRIPFPLLADQHSRVIQEHLCTPPSQDRGCAS